MFQVKSGQVPWLSWFLVLALLLTVITEESAEASRRRRVRSFRRAAFGRRFVPPPSRRIASCCAVRRQSFGRFDSFDLEALGRQAVDPFSSLSLDSTGDLSRLAGLERRGLRRFGNTNIAFDGRGGFFEQTDPSVLTNDRPLVFRDGKILGGAIVPLRDDTLEQVRLLNASGALVDFR